MIGSVYRQLRAGPRPASARPVLRLPNWNDTVANDPVHTLRYGAGILPPTFRRRETWATPNRGSAGKDDPRSGTLYSTRPNVGYQARWPDGEMARFLRVGCFPLGNRNSALGNADGPLAR